MTYIDREQLLEQLGITELILRFGNLCVGKPKKKISINKLLSIINNLPTADVVPISEVERWKNACMHEHKRVCELEQQRFEKLVELVEEAEQKIAKQVIDEFKSMVIDYVKDKDLLLVAFKNAVEYAETELKKKYMRGE